MPKSALQVIEAAESLVLNATEVAIKKTMYEMGLRPTYNLDDDLGNYPVDQQDLIRSSIEGRMTLMESVFIYMKQVEGSAS